MNRRDFLKTGSIIAAAAISGCKNANTPAEGANMAINSQKTTLKFPRYRGFNFPVGFGTKGPQKRKFNEKDFEIIKEWGFDFGRIPISYWNWADKDDWYNIDENVLKEIDKVVEKGKQYKIHINLNLHRIPGYCINGRDQEPMDLYEDTPEKMQKALAAAVFHWKMFAKRYKGIPSTRLSFDLINEPPTLKEETRHVEVVTALVKGIREEDPNRLIVADGKDVGRLPIMGIADLGVVQSTRGYDPMSVSHYTAGWVPKDAFQTFNVPTWPLKGDDGKIWDKTALRATLIDTWKPLMAKGVPVHVGEWGCFNKTPHNVAISWMTDLLSLWKEVGWGYAMWNLRGPFGVMDSEREDVEYEDYKGHKLDRKMLELMKKY
ncbi:MAG: cellulase family glycosylhydrolase [Sedimentisphaerales bacterium]|jgi:endoglucanase